MILSDPFETFRTLLAVVVSIYATAVTLSAIRGLQRLMAGDDPARQLLRRYVAYQFVTVRVRTFQRELFELSAWLAALGLLWWAHAWV